MMRNILLVVAFFGVGDALLMQTQLRRLRAAPKPRNPGRLQLTAFPGPISGAFAHFAQNAVAFRDLLTPEDVVQITRARNIFHGSWLLPLILYTLFEPPKTRLFPMSISWTIRRGRPRLINNALWATGWALFLSVVVRVTGGVRNSIALFVIQMIATGACATILCPLGSGSIWKDAIHWLAALAYMVDHVFLFEHLVRRCECLPAFLPACLPLIL
jgi:hypothetical protein